MPNRALTEIEQNVIDSVVKLLLDNLTESWQPWPHAFLDPRPRDAAADVAGPRRTKSSCSLVFDVRVGDVRGMLNLCIPAAVIEQAGIEFSRAGTAPQEPTALDRQRLRRNPGAHADAGDGADRHHVAARDLLDLEPGDVISLGRHAAEPVDVRVGQVDEVRRPADARPPAAIRDPRPPRAGGVEGVA